MRLFGEREREDLWISFCACACDFSVQRLKIAQHQESNSKKRIIPRIQIVQSSKPIAKISLFSSFSVCYSSISSVNIRFSIWTKSS